jgi:anti-anti-sigma regulatory factor
VEEAAYYKEADGIAYIRAEGHVTARLCPAIKARVFGRLDSPPPLEGIGFDLSSCEYMDSTFLGLIVSFCKRLASVNGRKPILHGTNEACQGLLRTIGVLGLVELSDEAVPALEGMERIEGGQSATARFLLDAHDALSSLSEENRGRFAALSSVLRKAASEEDERR